MLQSFTDLVKLNLLNFGLFLGSSRLSLLALSLHCFHFLAIEKKLRSYYYHFGIDLLK